MKFSLFRYYEAAGLGMGIFADNFFPNRSIGYNQSWAFYFVKSSIKELYEI